jgi:KamA family protein
LHREIIRPGDTVIIGKGIAWLPFRKGKTGMNQRFYTKLTDLITPNKNGSSRLNVVTEKFAFRVNEYYASLIDWNNPDDPIRRLIIPSEHEAEEWGRIDASNEKDYTRIPGLQHKYNTTCLLLVSGECGGLCRYCFRKRIFAKANDEVLKDVFSAIGYIREHTEITNVLLTGGDPLMLATPKLEEIISKLTTIEHVRIIRIGSKMTAFNPHRIIDDPSLMAMIAKYSSRQHKIYIINHFDHPREITEAAVQAVGLLQKAGAILCNQTPLIRGINHHPKTLAKLFRELSFIGVPPYYVFQCRPAFGNKDYAIPIEEGYEIFEQAKSMVSGLAKRAKFVMSHATGKIEIVGRTADQIYFKYHRAANDVDSGRFMVFKSNPQAYWLDDYAEMVYDYPVNQPYRMYGPE